MKTTFYVFANREKISTYWEREPFVASCKTLFRSIDLLRTDARKMFWSIYFIYLLFIYFFGNKRCPTTESPKGNKTRKGKSWDSLSFSFRIFCHICLAIFLLYTLFYFVWAFTFQQTKNKNEVVRVIFFFKM